VLTFLTTTGMQVPNWVALEQAAEAAAIDYLYNKAFIKHTQRLLSPPNSNTKLSKGKGLPIYGLTLAPAGLSGYQVCPNRSAECERACLGVTAGRSRFSNVVAARIKKTQFLMENPYSFFRNLFHELELAHKLHHGQFAFRSNVLSDIPWENIAPYMYRFPLKSYDYTKNLERALQSLEPKAPVSLTLSYSGRNWDDCYQYLSKGGNVAMVFNTKRHQGLPQFITHENQEYCVVDGDVDDRRYADPRGCIVGLRAKGNIDMSSRFVVNI
jgi:hypothetical protein